MSKRFHIFFFGGAPPILSAPRSAATMMSFHHPIQYRIVSFRSHCSKSLHLSKHKEMALSPHGTTFFLLFCRAYTCNAWNPLPLITPSQSPLFCLQHTLFTSNSSLYASIGVSMTVPTSLALVEFPLRRSHTSA